MAYQNLSGGFWGIIDEKGNEWRPVNMPEQLKVEGKQVEVTATETEEEVSIFMWGTPVRIISFHTDQALLGSLAECYAEFTVRTAGNESFVQILDCFHEMTMAHDNIGSFGDRESNSFNFHNPPQNENCRFSFFSNRIRATNHDRTFISLAQGVFSPVNSYCTS